MTAIREDTNLHGIDPKTYQRRWLILASMCLNLVLVVATVSSVNVAIPSLANALRPSDTQILWIVDAYALVFAGLLLFAGSLGDRFGRKGALLTGLTIFAAASILCSQSTDPGVLIAMRAVMGIGAALIMPSTLSLLVTSFPPAERPKAIAVWAGFAGAGGAIGPVIGGFLLEHFWYGSVFFVAVPLAAIGFTSVALLAPRSREAGRPALDPLGALASIVGFSALLFAIIEGPEQGWTNALVVVGFVVAAIAFVGFVWWERRNREPMLDLGYFAKPRFAVGTVGITVMFLGMFSMFFVMSQYFQYVRGYGPLGAGVAGLPFAFTMIAIAPRATVIADKIGLKRAVVIGMATVAVGLFLFSLIGQSTPYVLVAATLVVMAAGMATTMPSLSSGILSSVPMNKAGVGSAVNDTTREVGGAIGIAVVGSIVTSIYRSHSKAAIAGLPQQAAEQAAKNVGRAVSVARTVTEQAGAGIGNQFLSAVRQAFVDGLHVGMRVSAVLVMLCAAFVAWRHPAHIEPAGGPSGH
jgi:EmrB/QacA subfamily drug resistance transporter